MILADTSAWIEFDRTTGSRVHLRLRSLLGDARLATTQPVVAEVVAGARTDQREVELRRLLGSVVQLSCDAALDFDTAATIYRRCRRVGVTPRGLVDCVIAAVALRHDATLLAADRDLTAIAGVVGLRLEPVS